MKVCPKCEQTFNDDSLGFCLLDGTELVTTESQPTIVIERPVIAPIPQKKKNTGLWVGLIIVVMLFGIVAVAGGLMLFYGNRGESASGNKNGVNAATSTKQATPKPTPSAAGASTPADGPSPEAPKPAGQIEPDEVTPITWTTTASTFKTDVGQTYKFQCPENGISEMIWGSDVYSADSSICTAAVHAGIITLDKGGVVTVELRPGRMTYGSTVRNGITSNTYGEHPHSFVVR